MFIISVVFILTFADISLALRSDDLGVVHLRLHGTAVTDSNNKNISLSLKEYTLLHVFLTKSVNNGGGSLVNGSVISGYLFAEIGENESHSGVGNDSGLTILTYNESNERARLAASKAVYFLLRTYFIIYQPAQILLVHVHDTLFKVVDF